MNLGEASQLLEAQGRVFAEVYKQYEYKDDRALKDYLDFVIHEPVEWFKGFPAKLNTKASFAKPKTALIKLLKQQKVIDVLGKDYVNRVHDIVWETYKKHGDAIVEKRSGAPVAPTNTILEQLDISSISGDSASPQLIQEEDGVDAEDAESVHSVRGPRRPLTTTVQWERKYKELHQVVLQLVEAQKESPLYGALKSFLQLHAA